MSDLVHDRGDEWFVPAVNYQPATLIKTVKQFHRSDRTPVFSNRPLPSDNPRRSESRTSEVPRLTELLADARGSGEVNRANDSAICFSRITPTAFRYTYSTLKAWNIFGSSRNLSQSNRVRANVRLLRMNFIFRAQKWLHSAVAGLRNRTTLNVLNFFPRWSVIKPILIKQALVYSKQIYALALQDINSFIPTRALYFLTNVKERDRVEFQVRGIFALHYSRPYESEIRPRSKSRSAALSRLLWQNVCVLRKKIPGNNKPTITAGENLKGGILAAPDLRFQMHPHARSSLLPSPILSSRSV